MNEAQIDIWSFWKNKTKAEPRIYWAPISEEQMKAKALASAEKKAKESAAKEPVKAVEDGHANGVTVSADAAKERGRERGSRK